MKLYRHLQYLTRTPHVAQSGFVIKLEGTTAIIDRLLLAQRQAHWKIFDTGGEPGGDNGGEDGGGGIGGGGIGGGGEV